MRLTLLGVASFHRACLLAQDFTHEPACQTGDSAPQGRFRHQPEQMVHPPFAWQLASFPSLPVCGEEAPYCPLRDFATLRTYSPEIKARQALFAFLPVYPELVALIGGNIPNYQGVFLRGYGGQTGVRTHYFQGKENRVCRRHGGVPCVPCFIFPKVSWSVNCSFPVLTVPPVWMTGVSQRHRLRHQARTSVEGCT